MAEEKRSYLGQVQYFCAEAGNDWFRVYLVRKLTSQQGMECVQSFSRQGHPAQWVFPKEVIAQQVSSESGNPRGPAQQGGCSDPSPDLPYPPRKMCASVPVVCWFDPACVLS